MKVIALTAENLLRLKAVHIEPGDPETFRLITEARDVLLNA